MDNVELCDIIVERAFRDKKDLNDYYYIGHLNRVAAAVSKDLYIPAKMHDLLEDCPQWTIGALVDLNFPNWIIEIISILTKKENEPYFDYIKRVKACSDATKIKIADLKDNMDVTRYKTELTDKEFFRLQKYHKAYLYLTSAIEKL